MAVVPLSLLVGCAAPDAPPAAPLALSAPATMQGLKGSTAQVLNADFGAPALRRMDGAAQVWLYHSPVCGMDVFLYPDANGVPRVSMAVADNADPESCMESLAHPLTAAALERGASS